MDGVVLEVGGKFVSIKGVDDARYYGSHLSVVLAEPPGGGPLAGHRRGQWALYACNPLSKLRAGKRTEEWTAVAPTEEGVLREMARCLREFTEGRAPK